MSNSEEIRHLRDDLTFYHVLLRQHMFETDQRFGAIGERLEAFGAELKAVASNSEERWRQMVGRARLMEERFRTILGVSANEDAWTYCLKLDERIRAVEEYLKLNPPAA